LPPPHIWSLLNKEVDHGHHLHPRPAAQHLNWQPPKFELRSRAFSSSHFIYIHSPTRPIRTRLPFPPSLPLHRVRTPCASVTPGPISSIKFRRSLTKYDLFIPIYAQSAYILYTDIRRIRPRCKFGAGRLRPSAAAGRLAKVVDAAPDILRDFRAGAGSYQSGCVRECGAWCGGGEVQQGLINGWKFRSVFWTA
jgi:hypothetical protein